jgi:hypothetical protein
VNNQTLAWVRSSYSSSGNCVEAAALSDGHVLIRDTKDRTGPVLAITPAAWRRFADRVKAR